MLPDSRNDAHDVELTWRGHGGRDLDAVVTTCLVLRPSNTRCHVVTQGVLQLGRLVHEVLDRHVHRHTVNAAAALSDVEGCDLCHQVDRVTCGWWDRHLVVGL